MKLVVKRNRELAPINSQNTQNENRAETIELIVPEEYESFNKKIVFITPNETVWDVIVNNQYKIKNAITKYDKVDYYIWLTKEVDGESIDFRTKTKTLNFYHNEDASDEITDEEIHGVNTVVNLLEEEIEKVENLNIEATKIGDTTTVTITKKDGTTESVNIKDGQDGQNGKDGQDGKDAKINGKNSIEIEAGNNITIDNTETGIRINSTNDGGTTDYTDLENKPKINNIELSGNKSLNDLGIQPKGNYIEDNNYVHTDNNFNNTYKNKLEGLENYDDTEIKADISNIQDEQVEQNTDIENLQEENERLKATLPTTTGEGEDVTLDKTAEFEFIKPPLPMGNSEQEGEPSPENEVPITNVTGDVEVKVQNKNLIEGSQDFSGNWLNASLWETDNSTYNGLVVKKRKEAWQGLKKEIEIIAGKTYTFSCYIKSDTPRLVGIYLNGGTSTVSPESLEINTTTNWSRYSLTFTANTSGTVPPRIENTSYNDTNYTYICGYELEECSTATPYTPHKEQVFTFPLGNEKLMLGDYLADDGIHHVRGQETKSGTTITLNDAKSSGAYLCNKKTSGNLVGKTLTFDEAITDALIEYELEEEVIVPYTSVQQQVYNAIKQALSYEEQTNISGSSNGSNPIFSVEAYQDIKEKIEEAGGHTHNNKAVLDGISSADITRWNNKSNFSGNYNDLSNKPTKLSDFTNDTGFITKGVSDLTNYYNTAQTDTLLQEKADRSEIPDVSNFITNAVNNLLNYYLKSETYTKQEVNNLIGQIATLQFQVVNKLPQTGDSKYIYLVPSANPKTQNVKDEYIWTNNAWEQIGSTQVDLTGYATETWVNTQISEFLTQTQIQNLITTALTGYAKTEDIPTKTSDLTNDSGFITGYTETDPTVPSHVKNITQSNINTWNNKAETSDIPTNLSQLNADSTHRTVSDTEKNTWNNKSDFSGSYNDLSNKPTIPDELKDLSDDSTHRLVTDTEKSTWNNKGTYSKPSGGIPKTDLASSVQTSLGKADTALQSHQDISGKEDKTNKVTSISENSTDTQYPSAKVVYDNFYSITSDNKFNNIYDETGRLDPATGEEVSASSFNRTKFRDFGETITGNIYVTISETTANYMYICYYDENKVFKKSRMIWENSAPDTYGDYVEGVKYFRIATKNTWTGNVYISYIYGGIDTANYNYEKKIFNIDDVQKPLNGKIVINLGDSIFGKRRPPNDISTYISKLTGATVYNCGFGGTTAGTHYSQYYDPFTLHAIADSINTGSWTVQDNGITAGGSVIPDYFAEAVALLKSIDFNKVDMITIAYGTNDWNFGTNPIDNPNNSKDINSYAGAIRYSIEKILTAYPHIKIFLCTPIYRVMLNDSTHAVEGDSDNTTNTNGKKLTDFIEKLKEVALEYHLTYIDNYYGLGMNRTNWLHYFKNTDGTHPIITGIHLIAEHMAQVLIGDYTAPSIKIKTETSTTTGDVYDVTYINTMIGDVETILTTLTTGSGV